MIYGGEFVVVIVVVIVVNDIMMYSFNKKISTKIQKFPFAGMILVRFNGYVLSSARESTGYYFYTEHPELFLLVIFFSSFIISSSFSSSSHDTRLNSDSPLLVKIDSLMLLSSSSLFIVPKHRM